MGNVKIVVILIDGVFFLNCWLNFYNSLSVTGVLYLFFVGYNAIISHNRDFVKYIILPITVVIFLRSIYIHSSFHELMCLQVAISLGSFTRTSHSRVTRIRCNAPRANLLMCLGADKTVEVWRVRNAAEVKKKVKRRLKRRREKGKDDAGQ